MACRCMGISRQAYYQSHQRERQCQVRAQTVIKMVQSIRLRHASGLIGEDPADIPNNLMPFIAQVAVGRRERLAVFGSDYSTPDGTGVRDYIHVVDLAPGHVAALNRLFSTEGGFTVNLGTGHGYSVLDTVRAFEAASGRAVPYDIVPRRPGDIASCYASADKAKELLGWQAQKNIDDMCADHWRWQHQSPQGYAA